MIRIQNVSFRYPNGHGISKINMEIPERAVYLLTGSNGSGKSTLLKILAGGLRHQIGEVTFNKPDNQIYNSKLEARFNVSLSPQHAETQFSLKSVRAEIRFTSSMTGIPVDQEMEQKIVDVLGLSEFLERSPYDLLPADRKLLSLAIAGLIPAPTVAFDEPTAGLDPIRKDRIPPFIRILKEYGKTLVIVSHDIVFFLPNSTHIGIMDKGTFIESTSLESFIENIILRRYPSWLFRDFLLPRLGIILISRPVITTEELAEQIISLITDTEKKSITNK
jgi:energy-coupling factor transporter ATP-binding protein EcfA2